MELYYNVVISLLFVSVLFLIIFINRLIQSINILSKSIEEAEAVYRVFIHELDNIKKTIDILTNKLKNF